MDFLREIKLNRVLQIFFCGWFFWHARQAKKNEINNSQCQQNGQFLFYFVMFSLTHIVCPWLALHPHLLHYQLQRIGLIGDWVSAHVAYIYMLNLYIYYKIKTRWLTITIWITNLRMIFKTWNVTYLFKVNDRLESVNRKK